jgi:hypothetical protein
VDPTRCESNIVEDRHVGKEIVRLKDDPDALVQAVAPERVVVDRDAVQQDLPAIKLHEVSYTSQKGGLPRPGGSDQADDLVILNGEADVVEYEVGARSTS